MFVWFSFSRNIQQRQYEVTWKAVPALTRFMIRVRSPWASSSGVGGRGRFGGPPGWLVELAAVLSLDRLPTGLNGEASVRTRPRGLGEKGKSSTYSGFGGSLASSVPSFLVLSLGSSGSLSESDESMGSSGLTGWMLLLLLGVVSLDATAGVAGWRLLRGGASGCGCDCWGEIPNSFNCAASMSKS